MAKPNPILTAISCLGASLTPAAGARRGVRYAGVRGHTLQGKVYSGSPAIMQIGPDSKMVFRSATLLVTGTAFVNHGKLCGQSEGLIALGRFDCGSVYRRAIAGNEPIFI